MQKLTVTGIRFCIETSLIRLEKWFEPIVDSRAKPHRLYATPTKPSYLYVNAFGASVFGAQAKLPLTGCSAWITPGRENKWKSMLRIDMNPSTFPLAEAADRVAEVSTALREAGCIVPNLLRQKCIGIDIETTFALEQPPKRCIELLRAWQSCTDRTVEDCATGALVREHGLDIYIHQAGGRASEGWSSSGACDSALGNTLLQVEFTPSNRVGVLSAYGCHTIQELLERKLSLHALLCQKLRAVLTVPAALRNISGGREKLHRDLAGSIVEG